MKTKLVRSYPIVFLAALLFTCKAHAQKFVFADFSFSPLDGTCTEYLKQVVSVIGKRKGEVYIESDVLKYRNSLHNVWGYADYVFLSSNTAVQAADFGKSVFEQCNKHENSSRYWSDFLQLKMNDPSESHAFNAKYYSTCKDITLLVSGLAAFAKHQDTNTSLEYLIPIKYQDAYNDSVDFKNYLKGFTSSLPYNLIEGIEFLAGFCADKPEEASLSPALNFMVKNPTLISGGQ